MSGKQYWRTNLSCVSTGRNITAKFTWRNMYTQGYVSLFRLLCRHANDVPVFYWDMTTKSLHIRVHANRHTWKHTYLHAYLLTYLPAHLCSHLPIYIYINIETYTHNCTQNYTHTYTYTHNYTQNTTYNYIHTNYTHKHIICTHI